jgi:hypothetical protein
MTTYNRISALILWGTLAALASTITGLIIRDNHRSVFVEASPVCYDRAEHYVSEEPLLRPYVIKILADRKITRAECEGFNGERERIGKIQATKARRDRIEHIVAVAKGIEK